MAKETTMLLLLSGLLLRTLLDIATQAIMLEDLLSVMLLLLS